MKDNNILWFLTTKNTNLILKAILFDFGFFIVFLILLLISLIPIFVSSTGIVKFGLATLVTIFIISRAVSQLIKNNKVLFEEAILVDLDSEPDLKLFLSSICKSKHLNARMPSALLLHAKTDIFVVRDYRKILSGKVKGNLLVIGTPLLSSLSVSELRAVLSHEFAHLSGLDAMYISLITPFLRGLFYATQFTAKLVDKVYKIKKLRSLILLPLVQPWNLMVFWVRIINFVLHKYFFLWIYTRNKLLRIREVRADCIAAYICGNECFSRGLAMVITCQAMFKNYLETDLNSSIEKGLYPKNIYKEFRYFMSCKSQTAIDYFINELENIKAESVHPPLRERFETVSKLPNDVTQNFGDESIIASKLFLHLNEYEKRLSEYFSEKYFLNQQVSNLKAGSHISQQKDNLKPQNYIPSLSYFERRYCAFCLDFCFIFLIVFLFEFILQKLSVFRFESFIVVRNFIITIVSFIYFTSLESSKLQATLGKYFFEIRVENDKHTKISFYSAILRFLSMLFSIFLALISPLILLLIMLINMLMIYFGEEHRSIYDILSKTYVREDRFVS